jgi:antitoxin CptB
MNEIKQLRWRCRRGTLELDLILLRYLDNHYLAADKAEQMAFQPLLA